MRILEGRDQPTRLQRDQEYVELPREYQRHGSVKSDQLTELFEGRLLEYGAKVHRTKLAQLSVTIGQHLSAQGVFKIGIPAGTPLNCLPNDIVCVDARLLPIDDLDHLDGILTGCTIAIAKTGSIVLQNEVAQGPRRLSLVPDRHLCVVFASQIVETVPEAFAQLEATSCGVFTFISGPSATSDIEMTRVLGVHGPRCLEIFLVV